ncbi:transcription termination/antitermination protein NusG [Humibacter sp.]|uniref:transcription termination/antitermination protein NusG n=1 Tax=Humibacter sp. TaxID=1940291 RepID=UPI002C0B6920|nr:transcription termination/antitermination protein NusG [Humibacter sp.]HVX08890.1 transcription termination/antitermination protein NusG [Humibacter sp.]
MSERERDDVDWATAAEQDAGDDEAQEGNRLAAEEQSVDAAEREAVHVTDADGNDVDLDAVLDAIAETADPEADAAVDEALEIDDADEAEAAFEAIEDEDEVDGDGSEDADDADAEAEVEVDPYDEFKRELRYLPGKWYVIHSYAGFERRVKQNLANRTASMGMEDYIFQVEVPMEDVVEIKNGQRKMVNRVRIPGYVLVRMDLNEDSWSVVRHTPGVTGFVGNAHNPTPLRFDEAFNMLKSLVQVEPVATGKATAGKGAKSATRVAPIEVDFEIGETITIKEGSFAGLPGSISEIKPESGKLTVLVSLFERETPVELSFDQVTKQ